MLRLLVGAVLYGVPIMLVRFTSKRRANKLVLPSTKPVIVGLEAIHMPPLSSRRLVPTRSNSALELVWCSDRQFLYHVGIFETPPRVEQSNGPHPIEVLAEDRLGGFIVRNEGNDRLEGCLRCSCYWKEDGKKVESRGAGSARKE